MDSSGNGHAGSRSGASWSTNVADAADSTYSLSFDGENDYVDTTDFSINNDFSLAAWINPSKLSSANVLGKHSASGSNQVLLGLYSGGIHVRIRGEAYTAGTPQSGWQHLLVTGVETANGTQISLYRNGIKLWVHELSEKVGDLSGGRAWTIGQDWDGNSRTDFFEGNIDDVRIYDRALDESEISELTEGFAQTCDVASTTELSVATRNMACDVVLMASGNYGALDLNPNHNVLIRGRNPSSTIIGPVASFNRGFTLTDRHSVTLENMALQSFGAFSGTAIEVGEDAVLRLNNVRFLDNNANTQSTDSAGGAINAKGVVHGHEVVFQNNQAGLGGALAVGNEAVFTDSQFSDNSADYGGGLYVRDGADVTLSNVMFSGNMADMAGGAIHVDGASTVTIIDATVTGNTSVRLAGGIYNSGGSTLLIERGDFSSNAGAVGGAISSKDSTLTILDTYIWSNSNTYDESLGIDVDQGGAGVRTQDGTTIIERSLIHNNFSNYNGGGVMHIDSGSTSVSDSTLSSNIAGAGGGAHSFGGAISLTRVTLYENFASPESGAGVRAFNGGTVTLKSSILSTFDDGGNCSAASDSSISSLGFNIMSDAGCDADAELGDQPNTNPELGALTDNGGATRTFLPATGSPAIDGGGGDCNSTDQRGVARPQTPFLSILPGVAACDVGAVELPRPPDADNDTIEDSADNCPLDANEDQADLDGDNTGDACDVDIDGDNVPNASDAFPNDSTESEDSDGDGLGNNFEADLGTNPNLADSDGDGFDDAEEIDFGTDPTSDDDIPGGASLNIILMKAALDAE
ncbi:MAG: LamG-like jellyroll fold domain-containing protein [Congregibacter sp.]